MNTIYLGYDYGTTVSIVTQYDCSGKQPVKTLRSAPSAIQVGNHLVRSPKRHFSNLPQDRLLAVHYYREFSRNMLEQALMSFPKERARITITVPNAYKDHQCRLMLDTIREVGKEVFPKDERGPRIAILPEPIAAALFYVHYLTTQAESAPEPPKEMNGLVCVCDIGGGTTDLAIVRYIIKKNNRQTTVTFKVVCTAPGDDALGGDDIDAIIAEDIRNRYHQIDDGLCSEESLMETCRALKHTLSVEEEASIPLAGPDGDGPVIGEDGEALVVSLKRSRLNNLLAEQFLPRFTHQLDLLRKALCDHPGVKGDHALVDHFLHSSVILPIGGTSQIPILQQTMAERLNGTLFLLPGEQMNPQGVTPFDSVAKGAAIYSAYLEGGLEGIDSIVIEGRTLHTISIEVDNEILEPIVERNMPAGTYYPTANLFPLKADPDGTTFRIERIRLYEGDGGFVGDTYYGAPPQLIVSQQEILEHLNEPIYLHGRKLQEISINIALKINNQGRMSSLSILIPEGREDHSDYEKTISFIR